MLRALYTRCSYVTGSSVCRSHLGLNTAQGTELPRVSPVTGHLYRACRVGRGRGEKVREGGGGGEGKEGRGRGESG